MRFQEGRNGVIEGFLQRNGSSYVVVNSMINKHDQCIDIESTGVGTLTFISYVNYIGGVLS
ncbi:hypothetical protein J0J37_22535, partial [Vibrio vulnificus]|nr:hypothetical protein [Vibrio vulnificus]